MNGFEKLTDEMRMEMLLDARDEGRREAFRQARRRSESCDLDDYIRFLSEAMEWVEPEPTPRKTSDFRL